MSAKLLIVEDDGDQRELMGAVLSAEGYNVVFAVDGEAGLQAVRDERPDLVIVDVELPKLTGLELCAAVRRFSSVPMIFLSGLHSTDDRLRGLRSGADDYLTKPAQTEELLIKIERLLQRSQVVTNSISRPPSTFACAVCLSALSDAHTNCPSCKSSPPKSGWSTAERAELHFLGSVIGDDYVLEQLLGEGAVGQVYRAHKRSVGRDFACKIVDASARESRQVEFLLDSFKREAEVMARLSNPHIVPIQEVIELGESTVALIMGLVPGRPMSSILDTHGALDPVDAFTLARQAANGLHEVHEVGLTHSDIKPGNLMVEALPASGFFVRILDFGIAARSGRSEQERFRGTPRYAAPEQWLLLGVDRRTDIYALGCVLYEALSGNAPFDGDVRALMHRHRHEVPRSIDSLTDGLPPAAVSLVSAMLEKDPDDRPADMREVIHDIDIVLAELGTTSGAEFLGTSLPEISSPQTSTGPAAWRAVEVLSSIELPEEARTSTLWAVAPHGRRAALCVPGHGVFAVEFGVRAKFHVMDVRDAQGVDAHQSVGCVASDTGGVVWLRPAGSSSEMLPVAEVPTTGTLISIAADPPTLVILEGETLHLKLLSDPGRDTTVWSEVPARATALDVDDAARVCVVGFDDQLCIVPRSGGQFCVDVGAPVVDVVLSDDGFLAAVLDSEGLIRMLGTNDGRRLFTMRPGLPGLRAVAFASDGSLLGLQQVDRTVNLVALRCDPHASTAY